MATMATMHKLERCWFLKQSLKTMRPPPVSLEEGELRSAVFCQVTGVHLICQVFMNDLLTEKGQEGSGKLSTLLKGLRRMGTKCNLQLSDLGHRIGSFSTIQYLSK